MLVVGAGIFLKELRSHCEKLFTCDIHLHLGLIKQMAEAEAIPIKLALSDARSLPCASGCIDAIVSMYALEHLHDVEAAAQGYHRVLKPGSVAIIRVPVANLVTEAILPCAYLLLDGNLHDEHALTHRKAMVAFGRHFRSDTTLNIPRVGPGSPAHVLHEEVHEGGVP